MGVKVDLTGRIYGYWYVNKFAGRNDWHEPLWDCTCTLCNRNYIVNGSTLKNGHSKKCRSCSAKSNPKNREKATNASKKSGLSQTKLYQMLANMHRRCEDESNNRYYCYGAKGIRVCDEWSMKNVQNFYDWAMANGYQEGLEIDRIDVTGDYCPENCRFVTRKQNARNKTNSHIVKVYGEEMSLAEAVERYSEHPYMLVLQRVRCGMPIELALTRPKKNNRPKK